MTREDRGVRTCKYCGDKFYVIVMWENKYPRLLFNKIMKHVDEKHPLERICLEEKWKDQEAGHYE
jgi:hypothetical protein